MKKYILFAAAIIGVFGVRPVKAYDGNKVRFFTALEYWTPGKAYKDTVDIYKASLADFDAGTVNSDKSGGAGVRVGAFIPTPMKGLEVGGSIGYIQGPKIKITSSMEDFGPGAAAWTVKDNYDVNYIRILAEAKKRFPISETFDFRLGAGAGLAQGKMNDDRKFTATGAGSWGDPDGSGSKSFTGFTYEAGPSVAFTGRAINVELGVVYAVLPKMKKAGISNGETMLPFKWNPIGVRLGVEF